MKNEENKNGVSLFGQSEFLMDGDPLEEIFALNLGDFISEHLISEDLAQKIGSKNKDKKEGLKNQLKELISIYNLQNTLCVLNFDSKEKEAVYDSIANSITQMVEVNSTKILNKYEGDEVERKGKLTYVPMSSSEIVGAIVLDSDEPVQKDFLNLVESIASLMATSITLQRQIDEANKLMEDKNAEAMDLRHLRAELTALIGDLCDYQQLFVEKLAYAVDVKGQYMVSHSQNTANLARQICRELGLNEKTNDLIYYAGLLQNIGKITLPEKIFATNGKLSAEELKKIQDHINTGVNLLMNINFLSEVVPYVTYQSERYDGSGEPDGLKGQSIPFGSRIIAVANAYSAMTSDRPYRKAMDKEKALSIMKEEAGSKWDPVVVNALAEVV